MKRREKLLVGIVITMLVTIVVTCKNKTNSTVGLIKSASITVTAPIRLEVPSTTASGSGHFTIGAVSWSPTHNPFQVTTVYTAKLTLTADDGYTFTPGFTVAINGKPAAVSGNTGDEVILSYTFAPTGIDMGIDMIQIPKAGVAGPPYIFTMGSNDTADIRAKPAHEVTLTKGFYMSQYQVTQEQYAAVMGYNPSLLQGGGYLPDGTEVQGRRPVEMVNWYNAVEFCNFLSVKEGLEAVYEISGRVPAYDPEDIPASYPISFATVTPDWNKNGYRLPTEAEWEYACRAGTTTAWYTGNTEDAALQGAAWYYGTHTGNAKNKTHQVGLKTPNAWGLYDMAGNVDEWCWDRHSTYGGGAETDPKGAVDGSTVRSVRGGSFRSYSQYVRSAYRDFYVPQFGGVFIGFRVVRNGGSE